MNGPISKLARCAIYTRKSTEYNLELAFNSLDAQREACEAYIKSQAQEGWRLISGRYDDGAFSGASLDRPALQQLLADIRVSKIDVVLVYKVDRLTHSLADFAKLIELFDAHGVSFVSVTQSFNTSSSMGRLTLNVLLSFAQFERELIGERARRRCFARALARARRRAASARHPRHGDRQCLCRLGNGRHPLRFLGRRARRLPVRRPSGGRRQYLYRGSRLHVQRTRHQDRHRSRRADRMRQDRRNHRRPPAAWFGDEGRHADAV